MWIWRCCLSAAFKCHTANVSSQISLGRNAACKAMAGGRKEYHYGDAHSAHLKHSPFAVPKLSVPLLNNLHTTNSAWITSFRSYFPFSALLFIGLCKIWTRNLASHLPKFSIIRDVTSIMQKRYCDPHPHSHLDSA
jgi:hypothetical protein